MKYPSVFVNHGGGPLPLLGKQPELLQHLREVVSKWLPPEPPKSIVVVSAHWESDPIKITSSAHPPMLYDYSGFPPAAYKFQYPAPGAPDLAHTIQTLLTNQGLSSELDNQRGFDHGVFVPLLIMYPDADIPVVSVSLHSSLDPDITIRIGQALAPLREQGILILGSGYSFHNLSAFFHPTSATQTASQQFNDWLKTTLVTKRLSHADLLDELRRWETAPGARVSHPREEHLLPLFVAAAAGGPTATARLMSDSTDTLGHMAISDYIFN